MIRFVPPIVRHDRMAPACATLPAGPCHARLPDVRLLGRGQREIDNSSFHKGTAIGDSHDGRMPGLEVGDSHRRSQGKSEVGGGQLIHVIDFAIRAAAVVIWSPVPTGFAGFDGKGFRPFGNREGARGVVRLFLFLFTRGRNGFGPSWRSGHSWVERRQSQAAAMGGGGGGVTLACFLPPQPLSMSPASTSARIQMDKWPLSGGRT